MYSRLLKTPTQSILLFDRRGTGESTWIRDRFLKRLWAGGIIRIQ